MKCIPLSSVNSVTAFSKLARSCAHAAGKRALPRSNAHTDPRENNCILLKVPLQVARLVIKLSTRHEHARGVVFGLLELGRVLAGVGKTEAAVENLTQGLGNAVRLKDNNAQFVAHYHLWKIHLETGNHDRGRFELNAAKYFVQFVDERSPEADEVSRLAAKRGKP